MWDTLTPCSSASLQHPVFLKHSFSEGGSGTLIWKRAQSPDCLLQETSDCLTIWQLFLTFNYYMTFAITNVPEPGVLIAFSKRKYCYLGCWQHRGSALYIRIHDKLVSMAGKKEEIRVICRWKCQKNISMHVWDGVSPDTTSQCWQSDQMATSMASQCGSAKWWGIYWGLCVNVGLWTNVGCCVGFFFLEETNGSTMIPNSHQRKMLMKRKKQKQKKKSKEEAKVSQTLEFPAAPHQYQTLQRSSREYVRNYIWTQC